MRSEDMVRGGTEKPPSWAIDVQAAKVEGVGALPGNHRGRSLTVSASQELEERAWPGSRE